MSFFAPFFSHHIKKFFKKKALKLSAENRNDLIKAAEIIKNGGIVAFPFNGIYGLFGDINNKKAAEKIYQAKNRPKDKKLIMVVAPELLTEYTEIERIGIDHLELINFWKEIHALGVILPSKQLVPVTLDNDGTILTIWTEYHPLRTLLEEFRNIGGKAFIGTSANKSGQPTHFESTTLWTDFAYDVSAIIESDFSHLDDSRKKSTTVIDLSTTTPRIHRVGNVSKTELLTVMGNYKLPKLSEEEPTIIVKGRKD